MKLFGNIFELDVAELPNVEVFGAEAPNNDGFVGMEELAVGLLPNGPNDDPVWERLLLLAELPNIDGVALFAAEPLPDKNDVGAAWIPSED